MCNLCRRYTDLLNDIIKSHHLEDDERVSHLCIISEISFPNFESLRF